MFEFATSARCPCKCKYLVEEDFLLLFYGGMKMRWIMTWSLGLVLSLATSAHAQSEKPTNPTPLTDRANQTYFLSNLYPGHQLYSY